MRKRHTSFPQDKKRKFEKTYSYAPAPNEPPEPRDKVDALTLQEELWISVDERLPELNEDGESDLVLCVGIKGTHRDDKDFVKYEIMSYVKLDKPDTKDHRGKPILYGWSNRWWDTNPDLYYVQFWQPLTLPKTLITPKP